MITPFARPKSIARLGNNSERQATLAQEEICPIESDTKQVIEYSLQYSIHVTLSIYNILGQRITRIEKASQLRGPHSFIWDGTDSNSNPVSSGVYFYCLKAGGRY